MISHTKMMLRQFNQLRNFSSSRVLWRPKLSGEYKSKQLWDQRFNCSLLSVDSSFINSINSKIIMNEELSVLETDIFINIAAPRTDEIAQLQETINLLKKIRQTVYANMMLPSTPHATCRLFLDCERAPSLVNLLEDRINYGVFPDPFALNLLFDTALEKENYALASRVANLVMIQEEFGLNEISDKFALYSVAKYIESRTDFKNWNELPKQRDQIFTDVEGIVEVEDKQKDDSEQPADEDKDEDEDEDDAEYIRIPFLRNPYFDNHFDLTDPRLLCGKTLSMIGHHLAQTNEVQVSRKCILMGNILQGRWSEAMKSIDTCSQSNTLLGPMSEIMQFYVDNLHGLNGPDADLCISIRQGLTQLNGDCPLLSDEVEKSCSKFADCEKRDIEQFKADLVEWSDARLKTKAAREALNERKKLIEEIRAKKEELRLREQYLYFYDNLKKSNLTRMEYN